MEDLLLSILISFSTLEGSSLGLVFSSLDSSTDLVLSGSEEIFGGVGISLCSSIFFGNSFEFSPVSIVSFFSVTSFLTSSLDKALEFISMDGSTFGFSSVSIGSFSAVSSFFTSSLDDSTFGVSFLTSTLRLSSFESKFDLASFESALILSNENLDLSSFASTTTSCFVVLLSDFSSLEETLLFTSSSDLTLCSSSFDSVLEMSSINLFLESLSLDSSDEFTSLVSILSLSLFNSALFFTSL